MRRRCKFCGLPGHKAKNCPNTKFQLSDGGITTEVSPAQLDKAAKQAKHRGGKHRRD